MTIDREEMGEREEVILSFDEDADLPSDAPNVHREVEMLLPGLRPIVARGFVYMIFLTVATLMGWAVLAKVDVVVEARGGVIPRGEILRVNTTISGILAELPVEEGDRVEAGDPLCRIDPLEAGARSRTSEEEYRRLTTELTGLRRSMHLLGNALAGPEEGIDRVIPMIPSRAAASALAELTRSYHYLAEVRALAGEGSDHPGSEEARLRRETKEAEIEAARASMREGEADLEYVRGNRLSADRAYEAAREDHASVVASLEGADEVVGLMAEEDAVFRALADSGILSNIEYLERHRQYVSAVSEAERLRAQERASAAQEERARIALEQTDEEIARQEAGIERMGVEIRRLETELALMDAESGRRLRGAEEDYETARSVAEQVLSDLRTEEAGLAHRVESARVEADLSTEVETRTVLRSPVSGIVARLEARNAGEYVDASRPFVYLIPDTAPLVAEVRVSNANVAKIAPGMPCRFKFDAFPFQDFGIITGRIIEISPDIIPESTEYRVLAEFDTFAFSHPSGPRPITVGMQIQAEIVTNRRRVASYLLEPFRRLTNRYASVSG